MSTGKHLTWIHLSDLHFGHGKEATTRFAQQLVTEAIVRDAEKVAGELGPPDLIFLTGDIAFSASADNEYPAASEWLGKLLSVLNVGRERVLLVPGNHDVDRKKALRGQGELLHLGLRAKPSAIDGALEDATRMEGIWPKLTAYQRFATAFGSPEITPAKPFWTKRLPSGVGPIHVIGLNTALLSFDNEDSLKNLALGLGQLQRALSEPDRDALLLVLMHHPPKWLLDGERLLTMLKDWPHLLLCGHVHEQRGFVTLPLASRGNVELVAGAGHQDVGEAGEHAYAWGRLGRDGLEYFPRAWFEHESTFVDQRIMPPEDQRGYLPKLGSKYARYPQAKLPTTLVTWLEKNAKDEPASVPAKAAEPMALPASSVPTVANFDPANAHFSVPFRAKGDQVIGRAEALQMVRTQLLKGRRTAIGQTAAFVGLGGLGKTQLAVEYAHAYRNEYPGGVYWFNADGDLGGQLTRLAVAARWASPVSDSQYMLEVATHEIRNRSDCLIIFDNVEDLGAIKSLLPEGPSTPHLLITSRNSLVGFDPVPIARLSDEESLELLCVESGRSVNKAEDREAALRIAKQLEGLPLALELAGAYLRRSFGVSWVSYADLLEREGIKARGLDGRSLASFTNHNPNLQATLHIDETLFADWPLLREALDVLAWSGSTSMGSSLLSYLLAGTDSAALDVALGEAETLRILRREQGAADPASARFVMHRLVREVRRAEVALEAEPERWRDVLVRVGDWFQERRDDFAHLPAYEAELDHLETWQRHAERTGYKRDAVRLLWLRAYPHDHRGEYRRAHDIVQTALVSFGNADVVDPSLKANLHNDLGGVLYSLGDHRSGLDHARMGLDIRLEVLGLHDVDTARSFNNVGVMLNELNEHQQALEHIQRALDIQREVLGDSHADTAQSLGNLGWALYRIKDFRRSLECSRKALDVLREVRGEMHPETATIINNVALTLEKLGDDSRALDCLHTALAIRKDVLGDKHPKTKASWENIKAFLLRHRKKAQALALVEKDLKKFPHNPTLKRLKNEILGKVSAKPGGRPSASPRKPNPSKR